MGGGGGLIDVASRYIVVLLVVTVNRPVWCGGVSILFLLLSPSDLLEVYYLSC